MCFFYNEAIKQSKKSFGSRLLGFFPSSLFICNFFVSLPIIRTNAWIPLHTKTHNELQKHSSWALFAFKKKLLVTLCGMSLGKSSSNNEHQQEKKCTHTHTIREWEKGRKTPVSLIILSIHIECFISVWEQKKLFPQHRVAHIYTAQNTTRTKMHPTTTRVRKIGPRLCNEQPNRKRNRKEWRSEPVTVTGHLCFRSILTLSSFRFLVDCRKRKRTSEWASGDASLYSDTGRK